ncbi:MAG: hypothetical protein WDW38_008462 [Sanguina aurantia]
MGKRLNSLGKDAGWVAQYGTSVATDYLSPYVDLGQQSLRLFKKRSARHYRLAQDKMELLKEWVRDYLASRAAGPTDQQAQDPTQGDDSVELMDIASVLQNKPLLLQLSREYEELLASGADVDQSSWVRRRLQQAAAEFATSDVPPALEPPAKPKQAANKQQSLTFSRGAGHPRRTIMGDPGQSLQVLQGTGLASPGWQQGVISRTKLQVQNRPAAVATVHGGKENIAAHAPSGGAPHTLKVYRAELPDLWKNKPSAYVGQSLSSHAREALARPSRKSSVPAWVHTATLQAALQTGTKPELMAASERERRLAISSALAQQHLAAGVTHPLAPAPPRRP